MAKTYKEKLLDVRWQKRRLEIFEKDHWQCRACHKKGGTFHVHHLWYEGSNPWDAPDNALITLCSDCHETAPKIDWQKAFLDLNLCETDLLYLASLLHWRKKKASELTAPIQAKYKTRFFGLMDFVNLFEGMEDMDEFYSERFQATITERYTN